MILLPAKEQLESSFIFDSENGLLKNKSSGIAYRADGDGYIRVVFQGRRYLAHRIIWKMVHGQDPDIIDHINGNKSDNRIQNLRSVGFEESAKNRSLRSDNKSGCGGVFQNKKTGKWNVFLSVDGKQKYFGSFDSKDDAVKERKKQEKLHLYSANHGR